LIKRIVLLSGHICSGKTTLCDRLVDAFDFRVLKTKDVIKQLAHSFRLGRGNLQKFGDNLDKKTAGGWVLDAIARMIAEQEEDFSVIVDAVRIPQQIERIREAFGGNVIHIHLTAPLDVLEKRYLERKRPEDKEFASYAEVLKNKTEKKVDGLIKIADVVIDTNRCTNADVMTRTAAHLGLFGRGGERLVDVIIGGQYGSEGKGQIAAYMAREYDILVRVGGPNAGHTVFEKPKPFVFHQLPSGTRSSEADLVIGPGAVLNVEKLSQEIAQCQIENERLSIDPRAVIITPEDIDNEQNLVKDISSTGQGVGYATARRITGRGRDNVILAKDIPKLRPFVRETFKVFEKAFAHGRKILLEGTQGTGLSLYHGPYPHVTSRDTTVAGCLAEAGISPHRVRKVLMVCRTYPIRVADPKEDGKTSGYMSQPLDWEVIAERSGLDIEKIKRTEVTSTTKRERRVAEFDWELLHKAAMLNNPTDIALTFADYLSKDNESAHRFEQLHPDTINFIQEVEKVSLASVSLISKGFGERSIIDRRKW
jgi:adenylosuccinate synthase